MDKSQKYTLQTLRRVRDFLRRNAVEVRYGKLDLQVESLSQVIDRLTAFSVEQDSRTRLAKSGTSSVGRQIRQLRLQYMAPLSRLGRTLAAPDSSLRHALTIPRKTDAEGTVAAALGMADAAAANKASFIAAGFADDFAEQLRNAAREVKATIDDRAKDVGRRTASTAGVKLELTQGRAMVGLIDAMVSPVLEANHPSLLAEWRTLKKLARGGVTPSTDFAGGDTATGDGTTVGGSTAPTTAPTTAPSITTPITNTTEVKAA
jgi:hypothetical protein